MNKIPGYIWVVLMIFCLALGLFVGSFSDRFYINHHFESFAKEYMFNRYIEQKNSLTQTAKGNVSQFTHHFQNSPSQKERFAKDLGLTSDQSDKITAIISRNDPEIRSLRKEFYTKLSYKFEEIQKEIVSVLSDRQKKKFDKMPQPSDIAKMELYFMSNENQNPETNQ